MQKNNHTLHSGRSHLLLVLFGLLLLSAGFGRSEPPAGSFPQNDGKKLFLQTCAACHGQDAHGIRGLGKDLVDSDFARRLSDAELVLFIERGRPVGDSLNTTGLPMPPKGGNASLTRADLEAVVAYLRTLQQE